jgi:hypothetical protein
LPDFSDKIYQNGENYTKLSLIFQVAIKYTKWPKHIPNGQKIHQHFSFQGTPKFTQIGIFWLETIPSGNPAVKICFVPRSWLPDVVYSD